MPSTTKRGTEPVTSAFKANPYNAQYVNRYQTQTIDKTSSNAHADSFSSPAGVLPQQTLFTSEGGV